MNAATSKAACARPVEPRQAAESSADACDPGTIRGAAQFQRERLAGILAALRQDFRAHEAKLAPTLAEANALLRAGIDLLRDDSSEAAREARCELTRLLADVLPARATWLEEQSRQVLATGSAGVDPGSCDDRGLDL